MSTDDPRLRLLALVVAVVLLVGISVRLARSPGDTLGSWSRFLLVCLRLVIGWHFLVEGLDKLDSPTWTSEAYLREASGPLAPHFRELAGDRLADMLTAGDEHAFPAQLDIEWQTYLDAFAKFYQLTDEQAQRAGEVVEKAKKETLEQLTTVKKPVPKAGPYPPPLIVELTMPQRLEEYGRLKEAVAAVEAELPEFGEAKWPDYRTAKANLSKWRGDLKRDLDAENLKMKKALKDKVLVEIMTASVPKEQRDKLAYPKIDPEKDDPVKKERDWLVAVRTFYGQSALKKGKEAAADLPAQLENILFSAFDKRKDDASPDDPLPQTPRRSWKTWMLLDWSDAVVKYGLIAVGGCLLAGFLTRTACLAGALFLLSFFLAMPPLPWLPEGPRLEGHYLYINKNIIEMTALLALATMRTGRWAGVDGILQFLRPSRWRAAPASGSVK